MIQLPDELGLILGLALLALVPFIAVMATSFIKMTVVFSLLRNALGVQQIPPNMAMYGLAIILSLYVMAPVGFATRDYLRNHDVTYVRVARAPLEKLVAYGRRLGWTADWASSWSNDFNYDFHVSFTKEQLAQGKVDYNYGLTEGFDELPGLSVFYKDANGDVFHTYSSYARGNEEVIGAFIYLDITPKGRNEGTIMDWVKRNDEYENAKPASCCHAAAGG